MEDNQVLNNFNSQPHEEADDSSDSNSVNIFCISTHSLTKRLTNAACIYSYFYFISTHSLTKRLTKSCPLFINTINISTHSLTKRLTDLDSNAMGASDISTHSLTKRLTSDVSHSYL